MSKVLFAQKNKRNSYTMYVAHVYKLSTCQSLHVLDLLKVDINRVNLGNSTIPKLYDW